MNVSRSSASLPIATMFLSSLALAGCLGVEPADGILGCDTVADCPDETWTCRANTAGALRCFRGETADAGLMDVGDVGDSGSLDAPIDAVMGDAGDGGVPSDASDAGTDARPMCLDPLVDCPPADTCTEYTCVDGACQPQERDCDDGISCTEDVCVTAGDVGCQNNAGLGEPCGTGLVCTPAAPDADPDTGCAPEPDCGVDGDCDDGDPCTIDDCVDGSCAFPPLDCPDDTNLCTEESVCVAGACSPQDPVVCDDDGNTCTMPGVCNPATGMCDVAPVVCTGNDGIACTDTARCVNGTGCVEPFLPSSLTDPLACGTSAATCTAPCPNRSGATRNCVGGMCGFTCNPGLIDLDGMAMNGCEYACTPTGSLDDLDLSGTDANCDGADGIVGGELIYVSLAGTAANDGRTPSSTTTLSNALTIAGSTARRTIVMAGGTYSIPAPIVAVEGIEIWGGYTINFRARTDTTIVRSSAPSALLVRSLSSATFVGFELATTNRATTGESTHTVDVDGSTGVRFVAMTIRAGNGAAGGAGTSGLNSTIVGTTGSGGGNGSVTSGGGGGGPIGPGRGGAGGPPTAGGSPGTGGTMGTTSCGGFGGGGAQEAGPCMSGFFYEGETGGTGREGCVGSVGGAGPAGRGDGSVVVLGMGLSWDAGSGGVGGAGSIGGVGDRGGGGGGGGGIACAGGAGGGGGGQGGGGGGGGRGGNGGTAGGASIGILARASQIELDAVTIIVGTPGAGGRGGDGGSGASGGGGGPGGMGAVRMSGSDVRAGGNGGPGGLGGRGGSGGCGGGGVGGVAAGVFHDGTSTITETTAATIMLPAGGGAGGPPCSMGGGMGGADGRAYRITP